MCKKEWSAGMKASDRFDIFISYRREGGYDTAQLLYDRLTQMRYRVSFDLETLRGGKFNTQLYQRIEQCTDVLAIMSNDSLNLREDPEDDWFRLEIAHALKHRKNIVPVFLRDFKFPQKGELPPDIADLVDYQGVTASQEHFDSVLKRICRNFKAKPRRRKWPILVVSFMAMLSAAIIGVCKTADVIFPYPFTNEAKQRTAVVEQMLIRVGTVYDLVLGAEMRFLNAAAACVDHDSGASMERAYLEFTTTIDSLPYDLCRPGEDVVRCVDSMPVDKGTFMNLCDTIPYMRDVCKEKAKLNKLWYGNVYSNSDKSRFKRHMECRKSQNRLYGEYFAYGLMEAFENISESAIGKFKSEMCKWSSMSGILARWERNPETIQKLQSSALERLRTANVEPNAIADDQQGDSDMVTRKLVEISRKLGEPDDQIRRNIEEVESFAISNATRKIMSLQSGDPQLRASDAAASEAFRALMNKQSQEVTQEKDGGK